MTEKFSLKWNDFHSNVSKSFSLLRNEEYLHDVTLVGDDHKQISAHKLVLSACSEYFKNIFKNNKHSHPLLCLGGINHHDLINVMDYMYNGEVEIFQDDLNNFLAVAQRLKLEGLIKEGTTDEEAKEEIVQEEKPELIKEEAKSRKISFREEKRQSSEVPNVNPDNFVVIPINQEEIMNLSEKINEHIEICDDGTYRCKLCRTPSRTRRALRYHIETHMEGLSFDCPFCQKSFRSRNGLSNHKSISHRMKN